MGFSNFEKVYRTTHEEHVEGKVTFSDLKPNHYMFYYERYKIHRLTIVSAQIENVVKHSSYTYTEQTTITKRFVIKTKEGQEFSFDPDTARMYDSYQFGQPTFATYTAAQKYLDGRLEFCQKKIDKAQETIDKYTKLKEEYERCRKQMAIDLTIDIYKKLFE